MSDVDPILDIWGEPVEENVYGEIPADVWLLKEQLAARERERKEQEHGQIYDADI